MAKAFEDRPSGPNDFDVIGCISEFDRQISHQSFGEVTRGALRFLADHLGITRASIALLRAEGDGFFLFDATVDVKGVESGKIIPHGSASLSETVEEQRTVYRTDIREWPKQNPVDTHFLAHGLRSTLSVPMVHDGRCTGTLNAAAVEVDGIWPVHQKVFELVAPRLAFALEMGKIHDALVESEAKFRDVFETVGDGIAVADTSNRHVVMANSSMARLLGRDLGELMASAVDSFHPVEQIDAVVSIFQAMVRGERDSASDIPMVRGDGTEFLADVTVRRAKLGDKNCVVGVFRDAFARRQREQAQIQVQKLESIRTLAAGIAHDFNNLLTGLVGNVTLAQMQLDRNHEAWELLDEAQSAATRATALTRQLLTFAKGGAPLRGRLNVSQVLRDSANLAVVGTKVQCQFELPAEVVAVLADEGQLAQVFQNLVRNAVDVMPQGGLVHVRLSRQSSADGDEACIEICDQGPGIAPELLDKIFVPFFTTKSGGTGMGLAVAYSIIHNHGGRIFAVSELGKGTTLRVFLAVCANPAVAPEPPSTSLAGAGRILVMDDEEVVRHVSTRALARAGYVCESTTNGRDAVETYRRALGDGRRFDGVILDLTVPGGMGGREAATEILALDPAARLMVSSGYSEDSVMAEFGHHGFSAVLPKPYTAYQLCDAVRAMLR